MVSSFLLCIHVCGMHVYLCEWMYVPVYVEVNVSMWMSFWMIFPEGAPWIYSLLIQLMKSVSFLVPAFHSTLTNSFKYPVSVSRVPRLHECWDTHLLKVMLEFQISILSLMRQEIYHYAFFSRTINLPVMKQRAFSACFLNLATSQHYQQKGFWNVPNINSLSVSTISYGTGAFKMLGFPPAIELHHSLSRALFMIGCNILQTTATSSSPITSSS